MNDFFYDSWLSLLSFIIPGVIIGAVYDIFRVLRISQSRTADEPKGGIYDKLRPKKLIRSGAKTKKALKLANGVIVFIEDIIFWLIASAVLTVYIYYAGRGQVRLEYIIFALAGFFAYRESIGRIVIFVSKQIIFFCRCLIFWTLYIIIYPIKAVIAFAISTACRFRANIADKINEKRSEKRKKMLICSAARGFSDYM